MFIIVVKERAEAFAPALEVERIRMKNHTVYTGIHLSAMSSKADHKAVSFVVLFCSKVK